jgi:hypothetical protein
MKEITNATTAKAAKTISGQTLRPNAEHPTLWDIIGQGGRDEGRRVFTGTLTECRAAIRLSKVGAKSAKKDMKKYGVLCDYRTGRPIRPATPGEWLASRSAEAANVGGGTGVIEVDGMRVYVEGGSELPPRD